jgi:hypothetical protein
MGGGRSPPLQCKSKLETVLPMIDAQWQILNFRQGAKPDVFSGLKIGHRKLVIGNYDS